MTRLKAALYAVGVVLLALALAVAVAVALEGILYFAERGGRGWPVAWCLMAAVFGTIGVIAYRDFRKPPL